VFLLVCKFISFFFLLLSYQVAAMLRTIFKAVAVSAVAAFFSIGCGGGGGNPADPDNPNNGGGGGAGKLTISGLPSGGSWVVHVFADGTDLSIFSNRSPSSPNYQALGGEPSGNVFSLLRRPIDGQPFTGSGNRVVLLQNTSTLEERIATVNFTNGSATVPFSSFKTETEGGNGGGNPADTTNPNTGGGGDPVDPNNPNNGGSGRLTVTGLPSGEYGVMVARPGTDVSTFDAIDNTSEEDFVAVGYATGNVFSLYSDNYYSLWTGSGSRKVILINTQGDPDNPTNPVYRSATVNFSNGSATVPFSRFTAVTDDDDDDDDPVDPPDNPGNGGGSPSDSWPPSNILSEHGIGGLNLPPGTSDVNWQRTVSADGNMLMITATTTASFSYFENYFESNGWTFVQEISSSAGTAKVWQKSSQSQTLQASCSKNSSDNRMGLYVLSYETGDD
jgi:hypothetical protein